MIVETALYIHWPGDRNDLSMKVEHMKMPKEGSHVRDGRLQWFVKKQQKRRSEGKSCFGVARGNMRDIIEKLCGKRQIQNARMFSCLISRKFEL